MSNQIQKQRAQKARRAKRTRSKIFGTSTRPRMSVSRSLKHISVQIIDDIARKTLVSANDLKIDKKGKTKTEIATLIGIDIAKKALASGIKSIVFDRGSFLFHGRVKALAEAARVEGLEF